MLKRKQRQRQSNIIVQWAIKQSMHHTCSMKEEWQQQQKKIWKQNIIGLKNEAMRASFINFIEIIMLEKGSEIQWRWMEWAIFCGEWRLRVYRFDGIMDQRDD